MPLIDSTYFTGEINIPNISDAAELAILNKAIADYEPMYLKRLLGLELYGLFMAAYEASILEVDPVPLDDRFDYILNGHSYAYSSVDYEWLGLVNTAKKSPIAYYVYFMLVRRPLFTGIGTVQPKSENADTVSNAVTCATAWLRMREIQDGLQHMLYYLDADNTRLYPEYRYTDNWPLQGSANVFGI